MKLGISLFLLGILFDVAAFVFFMVAVWSNASLQDKLVGTGVLLVLGSVPLIGLGIELGGTEDE